MAGSVTRRYAPIEQWYQYLANNGEIVAIVAGLLGAVMGHLGASRFELNNGFRLTAAVCGFALRLDTRLGRGTRMARTARPRLLAARA